MTILQDGTKVDGRYYGVKFTGVIESARGLSTPPYDIVYTVKLDKPS